MTAVQQTGYALQYASENLRSDKEVVMTAVMIDWRSLSYMDMCLLNDLMFLGELWEYGGENIQKYISRYVTHVKSEIEKDPLYLAKFSPFCVKPAKK